MSGPTAQGAGQQQPSWAELRTVIEVLASIAGLAGYVYLIGGVITWVRLVAARLPADPLAAIVDPRVLFAVGLKAILFVAVVFLILAGLSYAAASIHWKQRKNAWHALFQDGPFTAVAHDEERPFNPDYADPKPKPATAYQVRDDLVAPIGEPAVRAIAGFNLLVLAGVLGLCAERIVQVLPGDFSRPQIPAFLIVTIAAWLLLLRWGPLGGGRIRQWVVLILFAAVSLLAAAPIGILVVSSVLIAFISGALITRIDKPKTFIGWLHSPLPWLMLTVYGLAAFAYVAQPPVLFSRAEIVTASGTQTGGYLARTPDGVYLVTCQGLADASSRHARTTLIPAATIRATTLGGPAYRVDSGAHPSLLRIASLALGLGAHGPTWFDVDFRPQRPTCGGLLPTHTDERALGPGVYIGRAPPGGRANDGELPIQRTNPRIAALAKRLQPTVETTVADRFWPVSVGAVLKETPESGFLQRTSQTTCLVKNEKCAVAHPTLADLNPVGASPNDSLNYPAPLDSNPQDQFANFQRGQQVPVTSLRNMLASPRHADPWKSAQIYFHDGGVGAYGRSYGRIPAGLRSLQYWFFYPYNYYPLAVSRALMPSSPIGGDKENGDLHEGDWEHVVVLVDRNTLKPQFLYLARHAGEGVALPWNSPLLTFDHGHPIVQAAYGGHPSYPNTCGQFPRPKTYDELADWVICGSSRYAFRAATTPLVDLDAQRWACWPGHFGEATQSELADLKRERYDPRYFAAKELDVAGPRSPLLQKENARACKNATNP
jgi:hypothetical protein